MPRDLQAFTEELKSQNNRQLTKSPEEVDDQDRKDSRSNAMTANEGTRGKTFAQMRSGMSKRDALHPYTNALSPKDAASCTRLEEEAFPANERCTKEKFQYRLKHCGELSLGIFTSSSDGNLPTADAAFPVYSGAPKRKAVLIGHIIATKTTNLTLTDDDMAIPSPDSPDPKLGHKEFGRTICIHSLAVLPQYQGIALGMTLMMAFLQRTESHGIADRAALISHKELIPYYEGFGFVNRGESKCQFGGGGWFDMVKELQSGMND
ncbi:hypothetical protein LTR08_002694 [Meristemomyces frigidus]|nr:hypothetical protein LTR08_002694 [Meristemomyces frigidus]